MNIPEEETNINFLRAKHLLETRIHDPEYLINFWKLIPACHFPHPSIENIE